MPIMINRGKEMLRISPKDSKKIEYSANQGRSWIVRYSGSSNTGAFSDLMDAGKEILGTTDKPPAETILSNPVKSAPL